MKTDKDTYQLPTTYFEEFQERLQTQLELEKLLGSNKSGFLVPEHYFDTLLQKLTQIPSHHKSPKVVPINKKKWQTISIAAAITILFGLFIGNTFTTSDTLETEVLTAYLDIESTTLHTEDILALLSEEELNTMILTDATDSEDEILDYLETYSNSYELILD